MLARPGMAVVSMSDMRLSGSLGLVVRLSLVAHVEEEAPLVAERGELVLVELRLPLQNDGGVDRCPVVAADLALRCAAVAEDGSRPISRSGRSWGTVGRARVSVPARVTPCVRPVVTKLRAFGTVHSSRDRGPRTCPNTF